MKENFTQLQKCMWTNVQSVVQGQDQTLNSHIG